MRLATLPAAKERILNNEMRNIGDGTFVSIQTNRQSVASPPIREARTHGLVQPIVWPA